jgi:transposase InsO family protein
MLRAILSILFEILLFLFLSRKQAVARYAMVLLEIQVIKRSLNQHNIKPCFNDFDRHFYLTCLEQHPKLSRFISLVKPATVLYAWKKRFKNFWTHLRKTKSRGRPPISEKIKKLIRRIKIDNYSWGYDRIVGALEALDIAVSKDTVRRTIQTGRKNGDIKPNGAWKRFLELQWNSLFACDFFTIDTFSFKRFYVFFVMELKSRKIVQFGITTNPVLGFVRNQLQGFMFSRDNKKTHLIHDNSGELKWFDYESVGIKGVATVPFSPDMNAYAERFVGSIRREFLDHVIVFTYRQLHRLIKEYVNYYNSLRPHQGIGNNIPDGYPPQSEGEIVSRPVLFGMYRHYYRKAA